MAQWPSPPSHQLGLLPGTEMHTRPGGTSMPGGPTTLTPAHWPLHKYGRNGSTLGLWGCKSFLCPVTVKYMSGAGPLASLVNL